MSFSFKKITQEYISRWVAFVITPLIAAISPAVTKFLNNLFSLHLDANEVKAFAIVQAGGVVVLGTTWLINRGKWERQAKDIEGYASRLHLFDDLPPYGEVNKDVESSVAGEEKPEDAKPAEE